MEFIVKLNKLDDLYIIDNASSYLIANRKFSYRYDKSFCLNKTRIVKKYCKENNKKVYVLVNKIFKDHELDELKLYLEKLVKIDVDGIFFADFAVFMLLKELNASNKAIFYHETFLRNTKDILTYQQIGIEKIIVSKDMNIEDIKHLPTEKKDTYGVMCFGCFPLYQSERKIISNYIELNNLKKSLVNSKSLTLKEHTREEHYRVIEQNGISSIFNSEVLSYDEYIQELSKNVNMFIFDSLFFDASYIKQVIELFKKASNGKNIKEELKTLNENVSFTSGFINKRIGLM